MNGYECAECGRPSGGHCEHCGSRNLRRSRRGPSEPGSLFDSVEEPFPLEDEDDEEA